MRVLAKLVKHKNIINLAVPSTKSSRILLALLLDSSHATQGLCLSRVRVPDAVGECIDFSGVRTIQGLCCAASSTAMSCSANRPLPCDRLTPRAVHTLQPDTVVSTRCSTVSTRKLKQ